MRPGQAVIKDDCLCMQLLLGGTMLLQTEIHSPAVATGLLE